MGRLFALSVGAVLVVSVAACNGDNGEESAVSVDTAGTPTSETVGETEGEILEVAFDGNECIVAGPTEVPPGDHAFVLTDESDLSAVLFARVMSDGYTYQDALDAEQEAGGPGVYWRRPSWVADVALDFDPPEVDLADNQQLLASTLLAGNHFLALYTTAGPELIWLCAPLDVVEP